MMRLRRNKVALTILIGLALIGLFAVTQSGVAILATARFGTSFNQIAETNLPALIGNGRASPRWSPASNKDEKAALNVLLTTTPKSAVAATLNKANHAAILNLSSGGPLNEARGNVGIALSNLLHGPPTPEKIDKAKAAVEDWLDQLGKA